MWLNLRLGDIMYFNGAWSDNLRHILLCWDIGNRIFIPFVLKVKTFVGRKNPSVVDCTHVTCFILTFLPWQTVDRADTAIGLYRGNVQQCFVEARPTEWAAASCTVVLGEIIHDRTYFSDKNTLKSYTIKTFKKSYGLPLGGTDKMDQKCHDSSFSIHTITSILGEVLKEFKTTFKSTNLTNTVLF